MSLSPLLFVLLIPIAVKVLQSHDPVPPTASLWRKFVTRQRADLSQVFEERGKRKDSRYNMLFASTHFSVAKCYKKLCPFVCPLRVLKKFQQNSKKFKENPGLFASIYQGSVLFLDASTHLHMRVCPFVRGLVRLSICWLRIFFNCGIGVRTA